MTIETVLVTGASGFLGSCLVPRLARNGYIVVGVSRQQSPTRSYVDRVCNLEQFEDVVRLFDEVHPAAVIHLASAVDGTRELEGVMRTFRANLASAVHVMVAASQFGCRRVILAGSMEELPVNQPARYPYGIAKRAATEYGCFFRSAYGLSVITTRIGMVYGPGQLATTRLVPNVILSQLDGRAPRLSSGHRRVDWVFVEDVADALITVLHAENTSPSVIEVGTGSSTSVAEVAQIITTLTGGPAPELGALPDRTNDVDIVMDAEGTARAIGWRAGVDLMQGLRRTVEWYRMEHVKGLI